jgi:VanZ family protein
VLVLVIIFSLTLQSPAGTSELSKSVQDFLLSFFDEGQAPAWLYDMHWVRSYAHIPLYFALSLSLYMAFRASLLKDRLLRAAILAFLLSSLVGLFDEFIMIFLPMREFDAVDWGLDVLASFIGTGVGMIMKRLHV